MGRLSVNKKGVGAGMIIAVILFLLLCFGVYFFWSDITDFFSKEISEEKQEYGQIIIFAMDGEEEVPANYIVGYYNFNNKTNQYGPMNLISEGKTIVENSTEHQIINVPLDYYKQPFVYVSAEGYYNISFQGVLGVSKDEVTRVFITLTPYGNVSMTPLTHLQNSEGTFTVELNTTGELLRPFVCLSRSFGIFEATMKEKKKYCHTNWTKYSEVNLPKSMWGCGTFLEYNIDSCSSVEGNVCHKSKIEPPSRLKPFVDTCFLQGLTLKNNIEKINIEYKKKDIATCDDSLTVWIVDQDVKQGVEPQVFYTENSDGSDIGGNDIHETFSVC